MAKLVKKGEQKLRKQYHEYLKNKKAMGKADYKKAKTYYAWKRMKSGDRQVAYSMARIG